ncbi:DNA primase [Halalkalibacterium ligniniphilum]|uniref:DNA primase n=1 Tax=Halalkalibacterium ligniniphilum TaxID=1134413 RepID=UPI00034DA5DE|nr:DNA primase [Halalkalibacterium ligniniphilum]
MNPRIPQEKIEEIRRSVDIVEVVSDYVQLKKQGRNYLGLCPFHGEKTPSFTVSADKQLYHCFGCGAGGNVFTFLEELEGYSFMEAVQQLSKRANISLPEWGNAEKSERPTLQNELITGHEFAAKFFHHVLTLTEEGKLARQYLKERGFTREQIDHFHLGFAPDHWDALATVFQKRKMDLEKMEQGGLLLRRESDGKVYDRFRNRVMFPIWDGKGNVIAFGGRILGDEKPKYLNSSESAIFQKGKTLYAFHLARPTIRKENEAVLFEGYVDVIAAWQAGIRNGIATLGTSLTDEQARLVRRNAETVILCYDSDKAGTEAAFRSAAILEAAGCIVKVAMMPEGLDPDDYIQKYGSERFKMDVIGASLTLMTFKMRYLRRERNLQDEGERMRYIEEVLTEIAKLPKAVERDHYMRQLASEFSLSLEALKQEQYQIYRLMRKRKENRLEKSREVTSMRKDFEQKRLLPAYQNAERILLSYMMKDEQIAETVQERIGGNFNVDEYHAIVAHLYAFYAEGHAPNPSQFIQRLGDETLIRIATEIMMLNVNEQLSDQELNDYLKQIETYPKWVEIRQREQQLKEEMDPLTAAKLQMEIIERKKQLKL